MKKCPVCKSSKLIRFKSESEAFIPINLQEKEIITKCKKCGYINVKRNE